MTNRISYALGVLLHGVPEPTAAPAPEPPKEVTLLGTPEPVRLYEVEKNYGEPYGLIRFAAIARYHTCEQAHAAHPGMQVVAKDYWRIGSTYLCGLQVTVINVEPKPKRAKGAK